ncbi:MAG: hypothetical protein JSS83_01195 [Cyanobacteria bacterium SZAS LIN-3]|nr:hypothetical protein [Cyanobacteria bacterium SZAS LIN-3]MBS2009096.1 hypothetical protein [Cyanobacteria bacterium SZAS TMP-1]
MKKTFPLRNIFLALALLASGCSSAAAATATEVYCELSFPEGKPIAQIIWDQGNKGGSTTTVNGQASVMATGRIKVPKNIPLKLMLRYEALNHMESLEQLGQCRVVTFNANKLEVEDSHLTHISSFHELHDLQLNDTLITDKSIPLIGSFIGLSNLRLSVTEVSGANFECLRNLKSLRCLNLHGTALKQGALAKLRPILGGLHELDLSSTGLTKEDASELQHLQHIQDLELTKNKKIDDSAMQYLIGKAELRKLAIADTSVTEKSLAVFKTLPHLSILQVRDSTFWQNGKPRPVKIAGLSILDAATTCRTPVTLFGPVH